MCSTCGYGGMEAMLYQSLAVKVVSIVFFMGSSASIFGSSSAFSWYISVGHACYMCIVSCLRQFDIDCIVHRCSSTFTCRVSACCLPSGHWTCECRKRTGSRVAIGYTVNQKRAWRLWPKTGTCSRSSSESPSRRLMSYSYAHFGRKMVRASMPNPLAMWWCAFSFALSYTGCSAKCWRKMYCLQTTTKGAPLYAKVWGYCVLSSSLITADLELFVRDISSLSSGTKAWWRNTFENFSGQLMLIVS